MHEKKILRKISAGLSLLLLLSAAIPGVGTAAPAKKPVSGNEFPVTGQEWVEWAQKRGMEWGTKYWPTKPVRGASFNRQPLCISG